MSRRRRPVLILLACAVCLALVAAADVWGSHAQSSIGKPSPQVRNVLPRVVSYLETKDGPNVGPGGRRWTLLCEVRYLGNSPVTRRFDLYVWEACQAYRAWEKGIAKFTGWSVPAVISVAHIGAGYLPVAERQPVAWPEDVRRMFPWNIQNTIWRLSSSTGKGPGTTGALFAALDRYARHRLYATK
jgi:hypothetical protein